jgi:hypothetical protein
MPCGYGVGETVTAVVKAHPTRRGDSMASPDPRSDRRGATAPDTDAVAADALPDEVRLHGDGDETEQTQTSTAGPEPERGSEPADES